MQIRRTINGSIRLTRFKEYLAFVTVTTLLGATAASNGSFGWKLIGVLLANWLAVAFAFMINDVEDAEDDALTPHKCRRNPVAARDLSPFTARLMSFGVAAGSALVYSTLGKTTFLLGMITLLISFLYSWKPVRLKNIAFVDFFTHGFMLSGLQFLTGYFAFDPAPFVHWIFPFLFIFCISCYGEMFNEMRDLDGDFKSGPQTYCCSVGAQGYHQVNGCNDGFGSNFSDYDSLCHPFVYLLGLMACFCTFAYLYPPCGHPNSSEPEWNRHAGVLSKTARICCSYCVG
jgi:4-hydroxybenzoate polyprenyltransferase and related prenyltransferases